MGRPEQVERVVRVPVQVVLPVPLYPDGHAPQVGGAPMLFVHVVRGSQSPLFIAHSSISLKVIKNILIKYGVKLPWHPVLPVPL